MLAPLLAALLSLAGGGFPRTVVDDVGRPVVLPAAPARIVSTAPSNTAALFALGVGPRVVGDTTYCVDPPEARAIAKIGDFSTIEYETLVALKPDLVVATWLEQRRAVERMESLGLRVLVLYPETLDGTLKSLERLGQAVGAEDRARALVADMRRRLDALDGRVRALGEKERPRVLAVVGLNPLYTAGPGSTLHEVIERAGGRNIAADLGKAYGTMSRETVIARDPQVVLVVTGTRGEGARAFAAIPGFDRLGAVRAGRVLDDLDPAVLVHQNQRLVDGAELLFGLLHPPVPPTPATSGR